MAGSAYPTTFEQISALHALGIRAIVTVHENAIDSRLAAAASRMGISCHHFHTIDRTPPSLAQLREICELMDSVIRGGDSDSAAPAPASASASEGGRQRKDDSKGDSKGDSKTNVNDHSEKSGDGNEGGGSVLVHCQGGVGRTNTVIAAYIMYAIQVSAADAINMVSKLLSLSTVSYHCSCYHAVMETNHGEPQTVYTHTRRMCTFHSFSSLLILYCSSYHYRIYLHIAG